MAETRTIRTVLELNSQRFKAGAAQASASARSLSGELGKISDSSGQTEADFNRVSNTLLGFGSAAAAGLGLAAKASMDWESAWAGVLKTVDGSDSELAAIEDGLRGLARELPASHQEIAAVAEAAGQLGVETDSVVEFTRTMINLGETTNLSADQAATGLARFSNIMGTSTDDVDRLGSTLVGLGNNFETTESEILELGMRLAGIGAQMGLTEGDVLGMAAAMSSVGISAEAGGTAMTQGMKTIQAAVDEGGESLEGFAEVAGMSGEEFAKLWNEDASAGLEAFITGLSRIDEQGGNVSSTLSDLGITGIRQSDTFIRLANDAEGFSEALEAGNTEFQRNLALTQEAAKRYETTESQLQIARNAIVDAGIDIGASVLPVLADVAGAVADVAGWFGQLPEPLQRSVTQFGAIAGASALLAGGLMRAIPFAQDMVGSFKRLRTEAPQTAAAMTRVGKAVGAATVAFSAIQLIGAYGDSLTDFGLGANEAADAAMRLADSANPFQTVFEGMGHDVELANAETSKLQENLDILNNGHWYEGISNASANIENAFGANIATTDDLRARLEEVGQGLGGLAQNDLPEAQAAFKNMWEQAGGTEEAGLNLLDLMPAYKDELHGLANEANLATDDLSLLKIATGEIVPEVENASDATGEYGNATDETTDDVEEQVDALEELQNALQETANALLGIRGSERDFQSAIDDANASVEEHGKTLDRTTEAGRANEAALDGIAEATHSWADAADTANASSEELDAIMAQGREQFIATAEAMGMGADEAKALADELGLVPVYAKTEVAVETQEAEANLAALKTALELNDTTIQINGDTTDAQEAFDEVARIIEESPDANITINGETVPAQEAYDSIVEDINNGVTEFEVEADTGPARQQFEGLVGDVPPGEMEVDADTDAADEAVRDFEERTGLADPDVDVGADTNEAVEELYGFGSVVENSEPKVYVQSDLYAAESELYGFLDAVNNQGGTVSINGESMDAYSALDTIVAEINNGSGTVMINGTPVNASSSLAQLIGIINNSEGTVTIDGNNVPANLKTDSAKAHADGSTGTIDVDAATATAESAINVAARTRDSLIDANAATGGAESELNSTSRGRTSTITGDAQTGSANSQLNYAARNRWSTIFQSVTAVGRAAAGMSGGGWLNEGLNAGGWVPGPYPGKGVDNTIWPVRAGAASGRQLDAQPLAGTEFVVNGASAKQWGPALEAINNGMQPQAMSQSVTASVDSGVIAAAAAAGARQGIESARITTTMSDRVAARNYQRGRRASEAYGGRG